MKDRGPCSGPALTPLKRAVCDINSDRMQLRLTTCLQQQLNTYLEKSTITKASNCRKARLGGHAYSVAFERCSS